MRKIIQTKKFKKDYKKIASSGRHLLDDFLSVVKLLSQDKILPINLRDHELKGKWIGYRECHIKPDWLLIYTKLNTNNGKELLLIRTGSHSELFS